MGQEHAELSAQLAQLQEQMVKYYEAHKKGKFKKPDWQALKLQLEAVIAQIREQLWGEAAQKELLAAIGQYKQQSEMEIEALTELTGQSNRLAVGRPEVERNALRQ